MAANRTGDSADHLSERLSVCYSGALHDTLRELGRTNCVLPSDIQPLDPAHKLAGRVFTMDGHFDPASTAMSPCFAGPSSCRALRPIASFSASRMIRPSPIWASSPPRRCNIVDGGCRDTGFILNMGFPVFCRYLTPRDVVGVWVPDRFGEPIDIGGIAIETGDYVFGNRDGVVIIPADVAEQSVSHVEKMMQTENLVRKAILAGMDPKEAYLKFGKF